MIETERLASNTVEETKFEQCSICKIGLWSGREKKKWDDKKRVENREGPLGYPGFVKPVFTKDGSLGVLG
ncbi:hypothetical protein TNCV_1893481 [Trichonephila clavipes]|nr:hypothetical protein TNCV_1893481 [Trichonephila clavipes]